MCSVRINFPISLYMKESKTFVSKAIMEDEIKLRQLERSLKLRVKTGCDTCR
jgi:hypothetical protein